MTTNYMDFDIPRALKWLKKSLNSQRFIHSIGTMEQACELARSFSENEQFAKIAGLMHDCAKCFNNEKLMQIIKSQNLDVYECELINYKTLHAPVSAYITKKEFGINNEPILSAIRWHTLGKVDMTILEKIIFLSDKIEPKTRDADFRKKIYSILDQKNKIKALDEAILICFEQTIKSLVDRKLKICHQTIDVYNMLLEKLEK